MSDLPANARRTLPANRDLLVLGGFIAVCYGVAVLGGLATGPKIPTWYASLRKPWFNPPNWIFGPVWMVLYGVIAYAGYRLWKAPPSPERKTALTWWWAQIVLNGAWSPAFFAMQSPLLGLVVIVPFWIAVVMTTVKAAPVDRPAAWLFTPYVGWVSFAAALNASILYLNM